MGRFRGVVRSGRRRLRSGTRQIDLDRGSLADLAVQRYVAARLLDEAVHHAEAESAALAHVLGGEEGLEGVAANLLAHAAAGIAHRDQDIGSGRSEEHTSELQSLMRISYAVFCLKKKTPTNTHILTRTTTQTQRTVQTNSELTTH